MADIDLTDDYMGDLRCDTHHSLSRPCVYVRERVLFIGTQFSILYTFVYSPA